MKHDTVSQRGGLKEPFQGSTQLIHDQLNIAQINNRLIDSIFRVYFLLLYSNIILSLTCFYLKTYDNDTKLLMISTQLVWCDTSLNPQSNFKRRQLRIYVDRSRDDAGLTS